MIRAYIFYGLMAVIEFVVLVNLFNVVRNLLWNESISQKSYIFQGIALLVFGLVMALVCLKLAQLPSQDWQSGIENLMSFVKTHKVWLISATVISFLGFITMGLVGMALIPICDRILESIITLKPMHGDSVWPVAIGYSIFLPWISFVVYLLWHKFLAVKGFTVSGMTLISVAVILLLLHLIVRIQTGVVRLG